LRRACTSNDSLLAAGDRSDPQAWSESLSWAV
jgi:hypothetical protein